MFNFDIFSCLLESLLALLATPAIVSLPSVYLAAQSFLQCLIAKPEGIIYLASHPDTTNGILRCLLQNVVCSMIFLVW